jgi:hypothetical protein
MALAHNLHLAGRCHDRQRPLAHHRREQVPAFIGRKLEQGLVDRGESDLGRARGLAVGSADLDGNLGLFAHPVAIAVGSDLDLQLMRRTWAKPMR